MPNDSTEAQWFSIIKLLLTGYCQRCLRWVFERGGVDNTLTGGQLITGTLRVQGGAKTYWGDDCDQGDIGHWCVFGRGAGLSLIIEKHEREGGLCQNFVRMKILLYIHNLWAKVHAWCKYHAHMLKIKHFIQVWNLSYVPSEIQDFGGQTVI